MLSQNNSIPKSIQVKAKKIPLEITVSRFFYVVCFSVQTKTKNQNGGRVNKQRYNFADGFRAWRSLIGGFKQIDAFSFISFSDFTVNLNNIFKKLTVKIIWTSAPFKISHKKRECKRMKENLKISSSLATYICTLAIRKFLNQEEGVLFIIVQYSGSDWGIRQSSSIRIHYIHLSFYG